MKKTLDTGSILNELQEGSAFFRGTTPPSSPVPRTASTKSTKETRNRTVERNDRTDPPNELQARNVPTSSVLTAIDEPEQADKRRTERYSFEIYTDQKNTIDDAKYLYYKKTGRKVSSSELLRDALDLFLARLMEKLEA